MNPDTPKKHYFFQNFIKIGGTIFGIILTSVGAIFLLNAALKLYVFGFSTDRYFDPSYECEFINHAKPTENTTREKRSIEDQKQCLAEKKEINSTKYIRGRKESMVDGIAMILVGLPLWIAFTRKKKYIL